LTCKCTCAKSWRSRIVLLGKYFGTFLQLIKNLIDNPAEVRVRLASHHQECAKGPPPTSVIRRLINSREIQLHSTKKSSLFSIRTIYRFRHLTPELEILIFNRHHSAIADKPRLVPPPATIKRNRRFQPPFPFLSIRCSTPPLGPRVEHPARSISAALHLEYITIEPQNSTLSTDLDPVVASEISRSSASAYLRH
jgi:hypothetical protein